MAVASVTHLIAQKQVAFKEEGRNMTRTRTGIVSPYDITRNVILQFARELVREYAEKIDDGFYLKASDLPYAEKKILLSYAVDCIELYEDFIKSERIIQAAFVEYENEMQYWIDEVIEDEFQDMLCSAMDEHDMVCHHHADNGEPHWIRR